MENDLPVSRVLVMDRMTPEKWLIAFIPQSILKFMDVHFSIDCG